MSKYDSLKFLKETKARIPHICERCGAGIEKGKIYYTESLGRVNAPGVKLKKYCKGCYQMHGNDLLQSS